MESNRNTFIVYRDIDIEGLTDDQLGQLFRAMLDHANGRAVNIKDPEIRGMWREIKKKMDYSSAEYDRKCESNKKAAEKRWSKERKAKEKQKDNADNASASNRMQTHASASNRSEMQCNRCLTDNLITDNSLTDITLKGNNNAQARENHPTEEKQVEQFPDNQRSDDHLIYDKDVLRGMFQSEDVAKAMEDWMLCREELGHTPYRVMQEEIQNAKEAEKKHGPEAVVKTIRDSLGYKRIVWDRLEKKNGGGGVGKSPQEGPHSEQFSDENLSDLEKKLLGIT